MGPAARTSATTTPQFQSSSNAASTPGPTRPRIGPFMRTWDRQHAHGPLIPHVNPMRCAWATLPTCTSRGLCAYQRVNAHVQGFAYKRHTTRDTTAPKTQTTSPTTPRLSAFFIEVVCTLGTTAPQAAISPPPNGGNGVIRTTTRRRHADSQPLMLQNPHRRRREGRRRDRRAWPRHQWAAARPRAVRAASFARRVSSKPGQAPPPPTARRQVPPAPSMPVAVGVLQH